jgi:hypothetical protein
MREARALTRTTMGEGAVLAITGRRAGDVPFSGAFQSKNALTCRRRRHI